MIGQSLCAAIRKAFTEHAVALKIMSRAVVPAVALGLIAYGLYEIYGPLAPLGVGLLLWADLTIGSLRK